LELANGEKFAIVRFVAWNASHDVGLYGFSNKNKVKLVKELSKYLRVFVSSEDNTIPELTKYQIRIRPEKMHDLMAFSSLFIGEGATMAEEAAVLGVPSIYVNSIGLGVIPDLVKYGLLDHFSESLDDQSKAISMALQYAKSDVLKKERVILRDAMLCERIDVSSFLTWFVENYPISKHRTLSKTFTFDRFR
jgi:predicted glycosyltransferase